VPRADYYILPSSDHDSRELLACKLCEKALSLGQRIHIHTENEADLHQLDQTLWNFRSDSFVPHAILGTELKSPVSIACGELPSEPIDLFINLGLTAPEGCQSASRCIEIVTQSETVLAATRHSWAARKAAGWELQRQDLRDRS
jgi:DNA polymerase III subunit chi